MEDLNLAGRTALVTAATSGIGLATAVVLARHGATVWLNGRSESHLTDAREGVLATVPWADLRTVVGDVSTAGGVDATTAAAPDVDILVNMAGGTDHQRPFVELTDADWQQQWDLNVMSGVRLTRHYVPLLLNKTYGRIVFVSSAAGLVTDREMVDYGVVKAAVIRLSHAVAEIFTGHDVTVNCVVPGATLSNWVVESARGSTIDDFARRVFPSDSTSLLRRFATPEEVASLIAYICSPDATAIRGAVLRADGGLVRTD